MQIKNQISLARYKQYTDRFEGAIIDRKRGVNIPFTDKPLSWVARQIARYDLVPTITSRIIYNRVLDEAERKERIAACSNQHKFNYGLAGYEKKGRR